MMILCTSISNSISEIPAFKHTDVVAGQVLISVEAEDYIYNEGWKLVEDKTRRTTSNRYMEVEAKEGELRYKIQSEIGGDYFLILNINKPGLEVLLNGSKLDSTHKPLSDIVRRFIAKWYIYDQKVKLIKGFNDLSFKAKKGIILDSIMFTNIFDREKMRPSNLFDASQKLGPIPSPFYIEYRKDVQEEIDPIISGYMMIPYDSIIQLYDKPVKRIFIVRKNDDYPGEYPSMKNLRLSVISTNNEGNTQKDKILLDIKPQISTQYPLSIQGNSEGVKDLRVNLYSSGKLIWFRKFKVITINDKREKEDSFKVYQTNLDFPCDVIMEDKLLPWKDLWKDKELHDIVVTFPGIDNKFIFWKGAGFCPLWTFEGSAFSSQWFEVVSFKKYKSPVNDCFEPLQDKKCKYSTVTVLEGTQARAVVEWKYPILEFPGVPLHGKMTKEVYTLYPDGIGIRNVFMDLDKNIKDYQIIEFIVVNFPGSLGMDNIEPYGLDIWNKARDKKTIHWSSEITNFEDSGKEDFEDVIYRINLKDNHKVPFIVVPGEQTVDFTQGTLGSLGYKPVDLFSTWKHWPLSRGLMTPNSGLQSFWDSYEGPTHSSLGNVYPKIEGRNIDFSILTGLITKEDEEGLLACAKSWLYPADIIPISNVTFEGFDRSQRAYLLREKDPNKKIAFKFIPSNGGKIFHPVFIINNFKHENLVVKVDGKNIDQSKTAVGTNKLSSIIYLDITLGVSELEFIL
ncbi:hypothetical protein KKB18_13040 [bacterium]|nr:hypothetical protein [bacterium]